MFFVVIDFCLEKCLICDPETNFQSLRPQWASKANCTQRKGMQTTLLFIISWLCVFIMLHYLIWDVKMIPRDWYCCKNMELEKNVNFSLSFRQVTLNFACARQVHACFFFFPFYDLIGLWLFWASVHRASRHEKLLVGSFCEFWKWVPVCRQTP